MKNFLLTLLAGLCAQGALRAQSILFEKDSLVRVFAKAQQQNKPVLVLLAPPPPPANLPAALRAARLKSGLTAPAVAAALNKDFLTKELAFGTVESAAVVRKYTVVRYPTYLYFNPDGSLLFRTAGNTAAESRYLSDVAAFRKAQAEPQNLSYFQREYQQGNRAAPFLKQFIGKRRELGQVVEAELLDAYVQQLPTKAFAQAAEVVFVLDNGPTLNSTAYQLTRLNGKLNDSLFTFLPLAQRLAINKGIISNSMALAIATNNRVLAAQVADYARRSWNNNYKRGALAYESNLLTFYRGTKDTASYLRQAVSFYDRNYMSISADSAKKVVAALRAFRQAQQSQPGVVALAEQSRRNRPGVVRTTEVRPVAFGNSPDSFLLELNNAAWAIYQTGTRNGQYLLRAMLWSRRTVDLDPVAYNYDTLAHLLYSLRFFSEAEAMQQQAVAVARTEQPGTATYLLELQKMKARTL